MKVFVKVRNFDLATDKQDLPQLVFQRGERHDPWEAQWLGTFQGPQLAQNLQCPHHRHIRPLHPRTELLCQLLAGRHGGAPQAHALGGVVGVVDEVVAVGQFGVGQAAHPVGVGAQQRHVVQRGGGAVAPAQMLV